MYRWTVTCVIQVGDWWDEGDQTAALRAALPDGSFAEYRPEAQRVTVQMPFESQSVGGATQKGNGIVYRALKEIGRGGRVVTLHAEGLDVLAGPRAELAGMAEAAEILGVTKPRASELASSASFPAPLAVLASGPVWDAVELRRYAAVRPRTGGRPRKSA